jgi:putative phosphoesterase
MVDGRLRLLAVADTHSSPHEAIAARISALAPAAILHAGDIGELAVLEQLRALAPLHAVRGNIDVRAHAVPVLQIIDITDGGVTRLRILMTHIALYGPRIRAEVAKRAREEKANLIVCGHSHVPFLGQEKGITVFNPGSIGPRRFSLPICFGTIDIDRERVRLAHVDCETGERWMPPA